MIRFVSSIFAMLFLALLLWFVVSNGQEAELRLALLTPEGEGLRFPMALWVAIISVVGFILGALTVWMSAGNRRSQLRKSNRSLTKAEDELDRLRADLADREADIERLEGQIAEMKTIDQHIEEAPLQPVPAI